MRAAVCTSPPPPPRARRTQRAATVAAERGGCGAHGVFGAVGRGRVWWPGRWLPPDPAALSSFRPRFRVADWQSGCREVNRARRAGGHTAEAPRVAAAARQVQGVGPEKPCREISLCPPL
ncbi:hypothetical protein PVAP13_5NG446540 [Panicum virgatum]|uniref:Uncharacterized protein n=1 Tax=Panicum virgatum TaxID=38727 RepID=A0A8T0RVW3_PANVG|nr:hypothetical protein PVAP13_5NG446540 [Panicum virgatum]